MSQAHHFQNENISVDLVRNPNCQVTLEMKISPQATKAAYNKAIKNINKEASVPGFRKGKAPESYILKNYGKYVDNEWKDLLLNTSFREALSLVKIYPYTEKSVKDAKIDKISLEEGTEVVVKFESAPEIPHVEPKELNLPPLSPLPITDKEIQETIEQARLMKALWKEIKDRPLQENDYAVLDIVSAEDPNQIFCQDTQFEVAEGKMGNWMRKLIIGLNPGDTAEGMSEKEEAKECTECTEGHPHSHEESHEFKPTLCKITVKSIHQATLPTFDDEFAKQLKCENIDDLKTKITNDLKMRAEREMEAQKRDRIRKQLLEKYSFEIPYSLVEGQMVDRREEIKEDLSNRNLDEETKNKQIEVIAQEVSQRLNEDFQLYFLTKKISEENQIQIQQEDLMNELMHQIALKSSGQSYIHDQMPPEEVRARLYSTVLINKTLDFLVENATKQS